MKYSTNTKCQILSINTSIIFFSGIIGPDETVEWPEQSFNFAQLSVILEKFLFTFKQDGIYIFDPEHVDVVLWSSCYKDIVDAKTVGDIIYIWTESLEMHALQVTPLDKCLLRLYFYKHYDLCSELCVRYSQLIVQSLDMLSKLGPLLNLRDTLQSKLSNELSNFLKHVEAHAKKREFSMRLESGIFLVDNHHARWKLIERSRSVPKNNQKSLKRSSRSRSLPPNNQNRRVKTESPKRMTQSSRKSSSSTNSLPELSKSQEIGKENVAQEYSNINKQQINEKFNQLYEGSYHDLLVPQIPLFPLASPDIIHDALIEIGNTVSGKLVSGTKSLLDRWQKVSQDSLEPLDVRPENYKEVDHIGQCQNNVEEEIVEGQSKQKSSHQSLPKVDVSGLVELCKNDEREVTVELFEDILSNVTRACNQYNEMLVTKKAKYCKGVFPFSHYLSKDTFLVITNWFHKSFKTGATLQWLYNQHGNLNKEEINHYPQVFQEVFSFESLELDFALSKVLRLFSEILDPFNILECLESLELPCMYLSWCVIIDRFQEGTFRYITKYGESENISCADWPMPLLLNAIFLSFRLEQVDSSYRMAVNRQVNLKMISYSLLKLVTHLEVTGMTKSEAEKRCNNLLLSYISKMIGKACELTFDDIGLVSHIESAFIDVNKNSNYSTCECAFPIPGAPISNAKFSEIGEKLISFHWEAYKRKIPLNGVKPDLLSHMKTKSTYPDDISPKGNGVFKKFFEETSINKQGLEESKSLSDSESDSLKHIMRVCSVSSSLLLWTLRKKAHSDCNISLALIIQIGLIVEFENLETEEWAREDWWESVIGMNSEVKSGKCCACSTQWPPNRRAGFTWSTLAMMMLKCLGSEKTLFVLRKHSKEILPGELDQR